MGLKLGIRERFVDRYASSRIADFIDAVRLGWNSYSFIFYIGSISAILVGLFGGAGWISGIITVLFFYYSGKFKEKVDIDNRLRLARGKKKLAAKARRLRRPSK